jgi:hypothetical protein
MTQSSLKDKQLAMAGHLRNPEHVPGPEGVEPRRLKIYQDLIYRNIEGFISGGFPVLRDLYGDDDWQQLVRGFIDRHRCNSPYFLEISQEFLHYLMEEHSQRPCDPPFMVELAHYEWVELALDVSEEALPDTEPPEDMALAVLCLSPLAWSLSYRFPVHRIGPGFRPEEPGDTCYLVVYRDAGDTVRFMELNGATARLLELFRDNESEPVAALLERLAEELGMEREAMLSFGLDQVRQFLEQSILTAVHRA